MGYLKAVSFAKLGAYWSPRKVDKPLSSFMSLTVICSNYGLFCKSEEFYRKGDWRKFEKFLVKRGWKVVGDNLLCQECYREYLDDLE